MKPTGSNPQNGIIPANLLRELERSTPFSERSGSASGPQALRLEMVGFQGQFIATAHDEAEVVKLEAIGAQRTLLPFLDAAERAADVIVDDLAQLCGRNGADAD